MNRKKRATITCQIICDENENFRTVLSTVTSGQRYKCLGATIEEPEGSEITISANFEVITSEMDRLITFLNRLPGVQFARRITLINKYVPWRIAKKISLT